MLATNAEGSRDLEGGTPLAGVRVLDVTHVLAGPYCTRILAGLGADVVRIESSARPDQLGVRKPVGAGAATSGGRSPLQAHSNRSKRSVAIDLKTTSGRLAALRLAEHADVLVENFSAGVLDRLGLGWEAIQEVNPRMIYASMSGYGQEGPLRGWRSMNMNIQGHAGLMMTTGAANDPPTLIANSWCDYMAALHTCVAVLDGLREREYSGQGRFIDLSQFECTVSMLGAKLLVGLVDGVDAERRGNRARQVGPQGCYPCKGRDEWCVIDVETEEQWLSLKGLLLAQEIRTDSEWDEPLARHRAAEAVDSRIRLWTERLSAETAEKLLRAAQVPGARVRRISGLVDGPSPSAAYVPSGPEAQGPPLAVRLPFSFEGISMTPPGPAPILGADSFSVLREWAGMGEEAIRALYDDGALR